MPNPAPDILLLIDDQYLEQTRNVRRTFHQPQKLAENPVLYADQAPWEVIPLIFGSVRFDPLAKCYRMWHFAYRPQEIEPDPRAVPYLALAESKDAIHWHRPALDVFAYRRRGKTIRTNLVFQSEGTEYYIESGSVLIDPKAPKSKRYLLVYAARYMDTAETHRIYGLAWSADGIHWQRGGSIPFQKPGRVDRHCLLKDPRTGEYLFYFRGHRPFGRKFPTFDTYERTVCFQSSPDLEHWSKTTSVMTIDRHDPPFTNIYSLMPFFRGPTLMGVYQLHYPHKEREVVTTHLCWSHDRTHWQKRRDEFISLGGPGEWDRFNNAVADAPLIVGDTMYFYYSGREYRHSGYRPKVKSESDTGPGRGGIGIAQLQIDRFASLEASFDGGTFTTKPMTWPKGRKLFLNADARWGKITLEAKSGRNKSSATIDTVSGTRLPVLLPNILPGKPFQLQVTLTNARAYALYWQ